MRGLSLRQASNCEEAREHVCRCRCGGLLHGARRGTGEAFFNSLPEDDPHYIASKQARADKKKVEREAAQQRRYDALAELYAPPAPRNEA